MQHQMDSPPRFQLTKETARERFRTWTLNFPPPNNIFPSNFLQSCFEQGMSDDCFCLAPQRPKPSSASSCELVSSESRTSSLNVPALESSLLPPSCLVSSVPLGSQLPTVSPPSTGLPSITNTTYDLSRPSLADLPPTRPLTNFLPSSQSTVGAETESLKEFFTAVLGSPDEKRVQRLVRVVQGFCKAKELPDGLYERLWPEWSRIFRSPPEVGFEAGSKFETEVAYRLRRLMQARQNIRKGDWEVSRLWLVFLAHEVEHISRWESIDLYTSRGIDPMSAAIKIAKKYFDTADVNYKRSRNIVQLLKEGGPASLLEDGDTPPSTWEKVMTLDDITKVFAYRRDKLPHLDKWARSHNSAVADAIVGGFVAYGWSLSGLLGSYTKVMAALNPYLHKRPHANGGPEESGSKNKRWRVDRSGASASLPDHEFPVNWLDRLSPSTYTFDQATSSRTYNNVESTPGSNCISLHAKNGTRDLIDPATAGNLGYAVNSLDEFTDPATAGNLGYAVNSLDEFTDPATAGYLGYAVNSLDEFTDPATAGNLGHAVNSSDEATDQATVSFLQSADHQPIHALSNDYGTNQPIDSSVVEVLRWTVNGPDELTDPSTDRFLQGATSATQLYLMDNCYPAMTNISSLPNTSTLGFIDPRTMSNQTAGSALGRMDC